MRRSYLLILGIIFLTAISLFSATLGQARGVDGDSRTITINRDLQITVEKAGQKQELIIPQEPLDFATTLIWEVNITKKISSEKKPAVFTIEDLGTGKQIERKMATSTGKFSIPKGKQYKVIIDAGEYMMFFKTGALVKANISFAEAQIKYSLGDKPFLVDFEITGPAGFNDWKWLWNNDDFSTGKTVSHQFSGGGKTLIMVEGNSKTSSGLTSQKYSFEFEVPPLVTLTSKIEPLKGPVELAVTASANAVVNYGQRATYSWNFGNSVEISGPEAHNTYLKPGRYQIVLTATVNEYKTEKTWLVDVSPETIVPNVVVTPALGPVPLKVTGTVNPKINGGPVQLEYSWELAGETVKGNKFEHTFTEPGDYRLMVEMVDKLHPDVVIPEEIILIKVLPPQIDLKVSASSVEGTVPLAVNFDPGKTITGNPVELLYRWEFGDGEVSVLDKPTHVFKRPGEYQVRLVVSDRLHTGNLADSMITVKALPPQMKVAVKSSITAGLAPLQVSFNATTSVTGSPCEPQYRWDFNDGSISLEQNPVHLFKQPGDYQVTLEVKDRYHPAVIEKVTTSIKVETPKVRLAASVLPITGAAPLIVKCQASATMEGTGTPVFKYIWDFGDGKILEGPEQSYTYGKAGTYTIQVSVQEEKMGITERKTLKVTVK